MTEPQNINYKPVSLSEYIFEKVTENLNVTFADEGAKKYIKLTLVTLSLSAITLASGLESTAKNLYALALKFIQFFIPKSKSADFNKRVFDPAIYSAETSTRFTAKAAATIYANFKPETRETLLENTENKIEDFYHSQMMVKFFDLHLLG